MVKEIVKNKYVIYYEGDVDETVLIFFIRKISENKKLPNKTRSNLKFILIELITNMISHSAGNPYGIIYVEKLLGKYIICTSNYLNESNLKKLNSNLELMNKLKSVKSHYDELLKSVSYDKSVNLGLIEIYNRCNGKISTSVKELNKLKFLTLKVTLYDTN